MDDAAAEKIARNNSVFRDANDGIETAANGYGLEADRRVPFLCECSDARCTTVIRLTLEEYRRVRSSPRRFAHAVGHEPSVEGAVRLLESHEEYIVVEKIGHAGVVAADLAARSPGD
jgi:hypothetical protein